MYAWTFECGHVLSNPSWPGTNEKCKIQFLKISVLFPVMSLSCLIFLSFWESLSRSFPRGFEREASFAIQVPEKIFFVLKSLLIIHLFSWYSTFLSWRTLPRRSTLTSLSIHFFYPKAFHRKKLSCRKPILIIPNWKIIN